ncbi:tail fiber assembly protein [Pseudomonas sp. St29]|uniref:tail fiber assembly protein n=1 Tax=Pseudomonas sp. St29 TaxID=1500687 RepID=UPI0005FCD7FF|nr:tail fiber assembly protein [Pseudomonas sp. St29]BAQ79168.1 tail assembly chaperone gp38 [Pseudomonas sp. St29]
MSWAVRNDGVQGWRAIEGADELFPNEVYSEFEPVQVMPSLPSIEELSVLAKARRSELLTLAAYRMGPLQDAMDIGCITDVEAKQLLLWKNYRISLNRIEEQDLFSRDFQWPLSPDEILNK